MTCDIINGMKILVLNNDLMELSVIQQVLQYNRHQIIQAEDSNTAMQLLQEGDIRFVIADRATTDIDEKQFVQRVRAAKPPYYIYILLITSKLQDADVTNSSSGIDDYLHKPVAPVELKSRVQMGERLLGLDANLMQAKDALDNVAMFDSLTNMLNKKAFLNLSRGELERARRMQSPLSLVALEINNLDAINQKHGEAVGKDVLVLISQTIREKSRPYDGTGHFEKSLFLIPLPGVIGQDAEKIASRLLKGITNTDITLLDGTAVEVNISIGIVSTMRVTVTTEMDTLIDKARELLLHIKRTGENQIETTFI